MQQVLNLTGIEAPTVVVLSDINFAALDQLFPYREVIHWHVATEVEPAQWEQQFWEAYGCGRFCVFNNS